MAATQLIALPAWLEGRRALAVGEGAALDAVAAALETAGARAVRGAAVADLPEVAAQFDAAGPVDLLVHAGTPLPTISSEQIGMEQWRATFSADLDGRFLHAAEFTRRLLAADMPGNILYLMPPYRVEAGQGMAGTAHGALDNLVKSLSVEWARDGIRVNAIASRVVADYQGSTEPQQTSLTSLAAYLLSDYAAYVTGTITGIDEV
ncbi:SDR family oxidoreductase [Sphingobium sp. Sx8-8]|uniref:SDR family oxidoreductase n=1 Tax=Sphingobium sp. Sx8-8 TaxID=2933617 RepID=UPI001F59E32B|nr:SDR family oxidoreductase [Sphingobium sp. Sx8-8]